MASFSRSAVVEWTGDVARGTGRVDAGSGAFAEAATFPRLAGEPAGATTPEELLAAASRATCCGIGLRSARAQRGGAATRVRVTSSITAEKGGGRVRVAAAQLDGAVEGVAGIDGDALGEAAREVEGDCTISTVLRRSAPVTASVRRAAAA